MCPDQKTPTRRFQFLFALKMSALLSQTGSLFDPTVYLSFIPNLHCAVEAPSILFRLFILHCVCFISHLNAFMSSFKARRIAYCSKVPYKYICRQTESHERKLWDLLSDGFVHVHALQGLSTPMQTQRSSASRWRTAAWLTWSGWMKPFQMTDASLKW